MPHPHSLVLSSGNISLASLRKVLEGPVSVAFDAETSACVEESVAAVDAILKDGRTVYGINTGFGLLASTRIPADQLSQLQTNLLLSHAAGTGEPLPDPVVRLIMVLKLISLSRGFSGVRRELLDAIAALLDAEVYPVIPAKGSVGASGDLAPLAHMACALLGAGSVRHKGVILPAAEGLALAGLEPMTLAPKEGLALINGTQASTAMALAGLFAIENAFGAAILAGALSVDALKGSDAPFDPRIHAARGQKGQIDVAAVYRGLLAGSTIRASHEDCAKVQDPYSLRCQPQVMGAILDVMRAAAATLYTEANAATDNPLVFAGEGDVLSGGNFHAEPVAFAADMLAMAACETGSISERRLSILVDPKMSGLPAFLTANSGLNSGFMIAQVTAAALVSENRTSAHPSSVDSIPTSANQEDHVSMAAFGARRLGEMAENLASIIGIELLGAAQGLDFHAPLKSSEILESVRTEIRAHVPHYEEDRFFAPDIAWATEWVLAGRAQSYLPPLLPSDKS